MAAFEASFAGADASTKLKLLGVDVASFGDAFATQPGALEVVYADPVAGVYKKLVLSDDARVRVLNHDWRGQDKPTNVLSFPAADEDDDDPGPLLGDVVVAFETTAREAREEGKTLEDHLAHLLVHGLLHLFGWDHEDDAEARPDAEGGTVDAGQGGRGFLG